MDTKQLGETPIEKPIWFGCLGFVFAPLYLAGFLSNFEAFYPTITYVLICFVVLIQLARGYTWDGSWSEDVSRSESPYYYWGVITFEVCVGISSLGLAYRLL